MGRLQDARGVTHQWSPSRVRWVGGGVSLVLVLVNADVLPEAGALLTRLQVAFVPLIVLAVLLRFALPDAVGVSQVHGACLGVY